MNPIASNNVIMQMLGAFMRGDNPVTFLQSLPQLQGMGLNLNDLEGTARKLYAQNGKDIDSAITQAKSAMNNVKPCKGK